MHTHDHEAESLRPKGSRLDQPARTLAAQAAAQGRWDVVGSQGVAELQRTAGNSAVTAARAQDEQAELTEPAGAPEVRSPVHDVISGSGRPLDPEVRTDMEARLGHDFGDVRVHNDGQAHDSAVAVNAHAYTVGPNIVFQRDRYDPTSSEGQVTLAHELTHVVQQRNGPVEGTATAGGIKVSDPGDRFEREASANAERVMSGAAPMTTAAATGAAGAAVQREVVQRTGEDEEEVQGSFVNAPVQREEDGEEAQDEAAPAG